MGSIYRHSDGARVASTGYTDAALADPKWRADDMRDATETWDYDTLVGTGQSGALAIPGLARELGKHFLIVRKQSDLKSSHSNLEWIGRMGRRWVFVDDFISSGATFGNVRASVDRLKVSWLHRQEQFLHGTAEAKPLDTTLVGYYQYDRYEGSLCDEHGQTPPVAVSFDEEIISDYLGKSRIIPIGV